MVVVVVVNENTIILVINIGDNKLCFLLCATNKNNN